jgi:uncharacterized caspase-like protein
MLRCSVVLLWSLVMLLKDSPLQNSTNDARDIAQALSSLGFDVIHKENLSNNEMKKAIRDFGARIRSGGVGLFYYAGHGVQVDGRNYLIPVGANIASERDFEYESVDLGFLLAQITDVETRLNIVILDACRNNPFTRKFRSSVRGLALVDAPVGTLIAYATAPGSVASDGSGRNGLYTQELLKFIHVPGLKLEDLFKRVRSVVRAKTNGEQVPWETSALEGGFYFSLKALDAAGEGDSKTDEKKPTPTSAAPVPVHSEISIQPKPS